MLVENLFEINNLNLLDNVLSANVKINADNEVFKGHFPDNPVTPGVMQVQLVKELIESGLDKKVELVSMGRCKFLALLNPVNTPEILVEVKLNQTEDGLKVNAVGKSDVESYFKFSAVYK